MSFAACLKYNSGYHMCVTIKHRVEIFFVVDDDPKLGGHIQSTWGWGRGELPHQSNREYGCREKQAQ